LPPPSGRGLVLIQYLLFTVRRRTPVTEELLSARMPESPRETVLIGSGGLYSAGQPLQMASCSIISCTTALGVLEFAVRRPDVPVFLHYIDRQRQRHPSGPSAGQ